VNVSSFIAAEKQGQGNVRRACSLLEVCRAAYHPWSATDPEERRDGIVQWLSRPGQCWDNAVAESFCSALKEAHLPRQLVNASRGAACDLRVRRGLLLPPANALRPRLTLTVRLRCRTEGPQ
jgi:transposase InsO family protein